MFKYNNIFIFRIFKRKNQKPKPISLIDKSIHIKISN